MSGTNDNPSPQTLDELREKGVSISLDQTTLPEADMYVYSDAWLTLNPTILEKAKATGKPVLNYFAALAQIANEYYLIAVAGTHGKTTTTAMLIDILEEASFDPSAIVGSLRSKTGSNYRAGKSKYFIVEADEYLRHFLHLDPDVLVITNIDHDHVDCYPTLTDVQDAFSALVAKVPEDGAIVAQVSDPHVAPVLEHAKAKIIDYKQSIDLSLQLRQPGLHNRLDAAAASATAAFLGIESDITKTALENFAGTARRFEYKGDVNGAPVYDDYAHNPQKVAAAIAGARELYPNAQLTAIFQPHTFSRTKELFADFVDALGKADRIILVPIYAAREKDDGSISSEMIVEKLTTEGKDAAHFFTLEAAAEHVKEIATENDVILVMGAGDVTKVGAMLTK